MAKGHTLFVPRCRMATVADLRRLDEGAMGGQVASGLAVPHVDLALLVRFGRLFQNQPASQIRQINWVRNWRMSS